MEEKKIDQWHPAFVSALRLDLQKYWDILEFDDEFQLTDLPQRVDCLVIKKVKEAIIDNIMYPIRWTRQEKGIA